jgi:hypothetical protein
VTNLRAPRIGALADSYLPQPSSQE